MAHFRRRVSFKGTHSMSQRRSVVARTRAQAFRDRSLTHKYKASILSRVFGGYVR